MDADDPRDADDELPIPLLDAVVDAMREGVPEITGEELAAKLMASDGQLREWVESQRDR